MRKGKELTAGSTCQVYKVAIVRGTRRALVAAGRTRTLKTDFFFEFFVSKQNFCFETVIPGPSGTRENKKTSTFFRSRNRGEKGLRIFLVPEHRGWSAVLRLSQDSSRHRDSFVYQSCCKSTRFGAHLST